MSVKVLREVTSIGDVAVTYKRSQNSFIYVDEEHNEITFKLQNGPIKEVGVNGCQVDTIIETAKAIIEMFQETHPCRENMEAIVDLNDALRHLADRKRNREKRNVEGTSQL